MSSFIENIKNIVSEGATYKKIRQSVDRHTLQKFIVFILAISTTYFSTYMMIQMQKIIDSVSYGEMETVAAYSQGLTTIIIYILLYLLCNFSNNFAMFALGLKFSKGTLKYLFNSYYKQNFIFAKNSDSGDIASKFMNDANDIASWLALGTIHFWIFIFDFIIIFTALYNYHKSIALFIVCSVVISFLLTRSLNEKIAYYNKLEYEILGGMYQFFVQANKSFMDVKQLKKENLFISKMLDLLENQLFYYQKKGFIWQQLYAGIYTIISYLIPIAILLIGIYLTIKGSLTIGEVIAIYALSSRTQTPLTSLADNLSERRTTMVLSERLESFVAECIDNKGQDFKAFENLEFDSKFFRYTENTPSLLKDIQFSIKNKDIICIKGKSGVGKSTIGSLLMQFYKLNEGSIKINGVEIEKYNKSDFYSNVNILSQSSYIFQDSIRNNIMLGDNFSNELYNEVINTVQLDDVIDKYTDELELDEDATNISGGQKQRIALARLLIRKPKLLILDEPTSALDENTALSLITSLKSYTNKYDMSLVVITHSSAFDEIATKVLNV